MTVMSDLMHRQALDLATDAGGNLTIVGVDPR